MNAPLSPNSAPESLPSGSSAAPRVVRRRRAKWVLALLVATVLGYFAVRQMAVRHTPPQSGPTAGRPAPVVESVAQQTDLAIHVTALGTVTPVSTVTVHTRVDGQLVAVHFREGQSLNQGTPLAEIDPKPLQAQKAQAEAQLARDVAFAENAKVDLERFRTLWSQDSVPKEQFDTQEALVRQYAAQVKLDQALVETASINLGYTKIAAPISGRAGLRLVDPGNIIHASDPGGLTAIVQLQPISVLFAVPQDAVPEVLRRFDAGEAQPVAAYARDGATPLGVGKVVAIDNAIDPATGTVKVRAEFANADEALFPNQFVNVELLLRELKAATVVPLAAVQQGASGSFAYVIGPGNVVSVCPLSVGPAEHDLVVIAKGLAAGDHVVIDGVDKLREGMVVTPVDRSALSAGTTGSDGGTGPASSQQGNPPRTSAAAGAAKSENGPPGVKLRPSTS
jgi:membrane fusion protein, multidrug efflux system